MRDELDKSAQRSDMSPPPNAYHPIGDCSYGDLEMQILGHWMAVTCAASVALLALALFFSGAWLLNSATLALVAMSAFGSAVIALMEFKSP
jgi:ABC-type Fe3+-siderophore transport system permease subunit